MSSLRVMDLVKESQEFVFSNMDVLKHHLKVIFPMILCLEFLTNFSKSFGLDIVMYITIIPILYLYGCFLLSWHRASLMGPKMEYAVNPLKLKSEDKGFFVLFIGLMGIWALIIIFLVAIMTAAFETKNSTFTIGTALVVVPIFFFALLQMIRMSFKLPAKSLNVTLTFSEARKASKGLIWKLLGAGAIVGTGFMLVVWLYGLIVALIVGVITTGAEPSGALTGFIAFIFRIPLVALEFILAAINVTVLSKAYQWGMQNNS